MLKRTLLIALACSIAGLVFLLGTTAGLRTVMLLADRLAGDAVTVAADSAEGRLLGNFVLHGTRIKSPLLSVKLERVEMVWHPRSLLNGKISIERLVIADGQLSLTAAETDNGRSDEAENVIGWLPDVSLDSLVVSALQINSVSNKYLIESLSGSASHLSGQLTLSETVLLMPGLSASMKGEANLKQLSVTGMQVQWSWQHPQLLQPLRGSADLNGDAANLKLSATLDSPANVMITADIAQLLEAPTWQAEFSIARVNLHNSVSKELPDVDLLLQGRSLGSFDMASLDATGSVIFEGVERPWKIDASVPLVDDGFPQLAMSSGQALLTVKPETERKNAAIFQINVPNLAELWPGLSGRIKGDGELLGPRLQPAVQLSLDGSDLVAGEQRLKRIEVRGHFDSSLSPDAPFDLTAVVDKAHIAGYEIDGNLKLLGTPQDARLDVSVSETGQSEMQMQLAGAVTKDALNATIEKLLLNSPDIGQWQAAQGAELVVKKDSGQLSGACLQQKDSSICSDVAWHNSRMDTRLEIKSLQLGTLPLLTRLNDYQLTGRLHGQLHASVDKTRVEKLSADIALSDGVLTHHLQNGEKQIMKFRSVTMKATDDNDQLQLDVKLTDADEGLLQARVSLPADIERMLMPETKISGQLDADLPRLENLNVFLQQGILPVGNIRAAIQLEGTLQSPRMSGEAVLQVPLLKLGNPATVFSRSILNMQLDGSDIKLQGESELAARPLLIEGEVNLASIENWRAHLKANIDGVPVSAIPAVSLRDDFTLDGNMRAKLDIAIDSQLKVERLDAEIALEQGLLRRRFIDGDEETLSIRGLSITGHNEKDQLLFSGRLLDANDGRLELKLMLPVQLDRLSEKNLLLDGHLSAEFPDLQAFAIFLDDVSLPAGRMAADITVGGTFAAPALKGKASLDVPRLDLTEPVLSFDNTHLDIDLHGNELTAKGSSQIDNRPIVLGGRALLQDLDRWNASLTLTAESVRLDDVFGSSLQASPDLALVIEPGMVKLSGDIVVEGSEIVIRDISSTIRPSSDVRIVDGQQGSSPPWRVITDLGLRLTGENRLRVAGFDGLLGGNVRVRSETGKLTSGEGALTVSEGTYRAFGATVPIRTGRLEFIGGTLDDPAIQIESRRRIEQREVGFDVTGTLQAPVVTLVSNPSMDQSEILSWLLYGRAAGDGSGASAALLASSIRTALGREEEESFIQRMLGGMGMAGIGVETSLTSGVGLSKQLTPRLFIKYKVDIWEQTNRLILRYHLGQHWALEGISGDEGGVDLLYERER